MIALLRTLLTATVEAILAEPWSAAILTVAIFGFLALLFWPIPAKKARG